MKRRRRNSRTEIARRAGGRSSLCCFSVASRRCLASRRSVIASEAKQSIRRMDCFVASPNANAKHSRDLAMTANGNDAFPHREGVLSGKRQPPHLPVLTFKLPQDRGLR